MSAKSTHTYARLKLLVALSHRLTNKEVARMLDQRRVQFRRFSTV